MGRRLGWELCFRLPARFSAHRASSNTAHSCSDAGVEEGATHEWSGGIDIGVTLGYSVLVGMRCDANKIVPGVKPHGDPSRIVRKHSRNQHHVCRGRSRACSALHAIRHACRHDLLLACTPIPQLKPSPDTIEKVNSSLDHRATIVSLCVVLSCSFRDENLQPSI